MTRPPVQIDIERRYMMGECHALAWSLAKACDLQVGLLRVSRHLPDGQVQAIRDPLHVFVLGEALGEQALDVKGARSLQAMETDFESLKSLLITGEGQRILCEIEVLDDPDDLYTLEGFDPSGLERAIEDAAVHLYPACEALGLSFDSQGLYAEAASLHGSDDPGWSL